MSKKDTSAVGLWLIALCGLLAGCFLFPTAVKRETLLLPVVESSEAEGAYRLQENGAISWELAGLRLEVEHMTDAKLNALFPDESGRGKYSTNPYTYGDWIDTRLGYTPNRFTVFKVTIFNRTLPKVMLDPLAAVLDTDQGQFLRAYGITSSSPHGNFENYYRSQRGQSGNEFYRFELRMGMVRSYNYEEDQPIFKGENYGGFIVFAPLYPETEEVVLTLKDFVLRFGAFDKPVQKRDLRFVFEHKVEDRVVQKRATSGKIAETLMISENGPSRIMGNLPGERTRSLSAIRAVVRQRLSGLNRCFVQAFDKGEAAAGAVTMRFTIEVGGAVSAAKVTSSSVSSQAVGQCMQQEIMRWAFRPIDIGALQTPAAGAASGENASGAGARAPLPRLTPLPVLVTYPFTFEVE